MKVLLLSASVLFFAAVSCNKNDERTEKPGGDAASDAPSCIQQKIRALQQQEVRNPPASVWRYTYNGSTVYYIPPYCCDHYGELYDESCRLICHPDGGIMGNGDGKCTDFHSTATNPVQIWQDPR